MSFQDELNKVSRTQNEIEDLQNQRSHNIGRRDAREDYEKIKKELLQMANNGQYELDKGTRKITLYYLSKPLNEDFKKIAQEIRINKTLFNRGGQHAHRFFFSLVNRFHYEAYMEQLRALAEPDRIQISLVGYYDLFNRQIEVYEFPLMGGSLIKPLDPSSETTVRIKCEVEY